MNEGLKPCPFCGSVTAPKLSSVCECEDCANFELEDCPECYEPRASDGCIHFVVCSVNHGGCGASSGWNVEELKAIEAWNRRAGEQDE